MSNPAPVQSGTYNNLNLEVLKRFQPAFEMGRRLGNAERAYYATAVETGDADAGAAVAAGILAEGESITVRRPGWKSENVLWPARTIYADGTSQMPQPEVEEAPWGDLGNDKRVVD